jgi:hypothetical protein
MMLSPVRQRQQQQPQYPTADHSPLTRNDLKGGGGLGINPLTPTTTKAAIFHPHQRLRCRLDSTEEEGCNHEDSFDSKSPSSTPLSSPPPPPLPLTQKKKEVLFKANARARRCLHLNDYTDEEIAATWYSRAELDEVRREARLSVEIIAAAGRGGMDLDLEEYCLRGIEFLNLEGAKHKMENKMAAWDALFDEQDLQLEDGTIDLEMLSMVYFDASYHSQLEAQERARCDEQAVRGEETSILLLQSPQPQLIASATPERRNSISNNAIISANQKHVVSCPAA